MACPAYSNGLLYLLSNTNVVVVGIMVNCLWFYGQKNNNNQLSLGILLFYKSIMFTLNVIFFHANDNSVYTGNWHLPIDIWCMPGTIVE